MRDPKNILDVAVLQPDFMGFIFYEKSKRYVGEGFVIPKNFPKEIKRVGVFVNESPENILKQVAIHQLDYVQLHGDESVQICEILKKKTGVIKVFRVDDDFDFTQTKQFNSFADFFMFETKSVEYGGSGKTFNWNLLEKYDQTKPFFLSGGLTVDNIPRVKIMTSVNLFALDVNSGAEILPGIKSVSILNTISYLLNSFPNEVHS